ncbi:hypothetical protein [Arthrobacter sp.]|uniref:hypothetical protein n=1 Tax=Arthrobacter sp. TaxID=1667 RepID=UPI003A92AF4F
MGEVEITPAFIASAMTQPGVLAHLQVVANRVKARAEGIAASEEVDMQVTTVAGVRPKGRPFVNVVADNAEQEWGSSRTGRRRILGRAAAGG